MLGLFQSTHAHNARTVRYPPEVQPRAVKVPGQFIKHYIDLVVVPFPGGAPFPAFIKHCPGFKRNVPYEYKPLAAQALKHLPYQPRLFPAVKVMYGVCADYIVKPPVLYRVGKSAAEIMLH